MHSSGERKSTHGRHPEYRIARTQSRLRLSTSGMDSRSVGDVVSVLDRGPIRLRGVMKVGAAVILSALIAAAPVSAMSDVKIRVQKPIDCPPTLKV